MCLSMYVLRTVSLDKIFMLYKYLLVLIIMSAFSQMIPRCIHYTLKLKHSHTCTHYKDIKTHIYTNFSLNISPPLPCTHTHACTQARAHAQTYTHTHTHTYTHMHTHTHTHAHTHTHTQTLILLEAGWRQLPVGNISSKRQTKSES